MNKRKPITHCPRAYGPRTAQNGRPQWFSADAGSLLRIEHCKHAAKHHLNARATTSTVIRRALALYSLHIDQLIALPAEHAVLRQEAAVLHQCNKGDTTDLPEGLVLREPGRPLREIIKAHNESQPKLIDMLTADLHRWRREAESETEGTETE